MQFFFHLTGKISFFLIADFSHFSMSSLITQKRHASTFRNDKNQSSIFCCRKLITFHTKQHSTTSEWHFLYALFLNTAIRCFQLVCCTGISTQTIWAKRRAHGKNKIPLFVSWSIQFSWMKSTHGSLFLSSRSHSLQFSSGCFSAFQLRHIEGKRIFPKMAFSVSRDTFLYFLSRLLCFHFDNVFMKFSVENKNNSWPETTQRQRSSL